MRGRSGCSKREVVGTMSEGADEGGAPRAPAAERSGDAEEAPPLREPRRPAKAPEGGLRERKPSPSAREAGAAARRPAPAPAGAPAGAGASEKDRKDLMKMVVQQNKKQAAQTADTCAVVVGTAQCGKSTLLKGLLNKDEEPQATLALEYSYCSKTTQGRKDIAHIWEVGGGTAMQNLLDVALTESSVRTATVVIVADLSKPEEVFAGVSYWLSRLRARLQDIDKELKKKETTAKVMDQLRERSAKKFGERWMDQLKSRPAKEDGADKKESTAHPDQKLVMHTGVNVVIVATKWDSFAKKDPDLLKVMGRCLRFLAHSNGASLVYCGKGDKVLVDKFRAVLSHHLFRTPPIKSTETNHLKPLLVPAGTDTLRVRIPCCCGACCAAAHMPLQNPCAGVPRIRCTRMGMQLLSLPRARPPFPCPPPLRTRAHRSGVLMAGHRVTVGRQVNDGSGHEARRSVEAGL